MNPFEPPKEMGTEYRSLSEVPEQSLAMAFVAFAIAAAVIALIPIALCGIVGFVFRFWP